MKFLVWESTDLMGKAEPICMANRVYRGAVFERWSLDVRIQEIHGLKGIYHINKEHFYSN